MLVICGFPGQTQYLLPLNDRRQDEIIPLDHRRMDPDPSLYRDVQQSPSLMNGLPGDFVRDTQLDQVGVECHHIGHAVVELREGKASKVLHETRSRGIGRVVDFEQLIERRLVWEVKRHQGEREGPRTIEVNRHEVELTSRVYLGPELRWLRRRERVDRLGEDEHWMSSSIGNSGYPVRDTVGRVLLVNDAISDGVGRGSGRRSRVALRRGLSEWRQYRTRSGPIIRCLRLKRDTLSLVRRDGDLNCSRWLLFFLGNVFRRCTEGLTVGEEVTKVSTLG